jgi:GT2 family glycosyltransferase
VKLSVVVTPGRRGRNVCDVIDALGRQDLPPRDFELIVVDRTPGAWYSAKVAAMASQSGTACRYLVSDTWGRARAQNIGIAAAANEAVLFLCEDFHPPRPLLGRHLEFHRRNPEPWRAVAGPAARAHHAQSPLTAWVDREVAPFHPPAGADADDVSPWNTNFSNLSLKRAFLLEQGTFDEEFSSEGFEDIDLALRLHAHGLRVSFDESLEVAHDHEVDLHEYLLRWRLAACGARRFDAKHPGLRLNQEPQDATMPIRRALLDCAKSWLAMLRDSGAARRERHYLKRTQLAFLLGYRARPARIRYPGEFDETSRLSAAAPARGRRA